MTESKDLLEYFMAFMCYVPECTWQVCHQGQGIIDYLETRYSSTLLC